MKIWGYSERGVMNALFYGIAFGKNKIVKLKMLFDILKIKVAKRELFNSEIIIEPSLSKYYGTPDLIIFYGVNNEHVVFIEAKVKTNQKKEENFSGNKTADFQQKRIIKLCSRIKRLKKIYRDDVLNIINELNCKYIEKIGQHPIVNNIVSKIIATVSEPVFRQILPNTWTIIRHKFNRSVLSKLEDVFINNPNQICQE